jgi:hypothetical protein
MLIEKPRMPSLIRNLQTEPNELSRARLIVRAPHPIPDRRHASPPLIRFFQRYGDLPPNIYRRLIIDLET